MLDAHAASQHVKRRSSSGDMGRARGSHAGTRLRLCLAGREGDGRCDPRSTTAQRHARASHGRPKHAGARACVHVLTPVLTPPDPEAAPKSRTTLGLPSRGSGEPGSGLSAQMGVPRVALENLSTLGKKEYYVDTSQERRPRAERRSESEEEKKGSQQGSWPGTMGECPPRTHRASICM